jgi:hypothetical protein
MRVKRLSLVLLGTVGVLLACLTVLLLSRKEPSMISLDAALVRTDFSDNSAWQTIRVAATKVPPEVQSYIEITKATNAHIGADVSQLDGPMEFVNVIDDPRNADSSVDELLNTVAKDSKDACLFIADRHAITTPDHPILVVDLQDKRKRTFRTVPSEVYWIVSNLSIGNMDWEEFADSVDSRGVFRGFPQPKTNSPSKN